MEKDHRKIEKMVPKRFLKWKKVFRKVESERMLTRKIWDYAIDLKETLLRRKPIFCKNITGEVLILLFFTFESTLEFPYVPQE